MRLVWSLKSQKDLLTQPWESVQYLLLKEFIEATNQHTTVSIFLAS